MDSNSTKNPATDALEEELASYDPQLPTEDLFATELESESEEEWEEAPLLSLEAEPTASSPATKEGLMRWDEALTLEGQIEAVLFAAPKPLSVQDIAEILSDEDKVIEALAIERVVHQLEVLYRERNGGFRLEHDKGIGYQFRTVAAAAPLMERMFAARQRPLSRAALETLSIIAYRQPTTRADIEAIRGVDAGSIIKNLLDRELILCVGRKEDSGRPMMFGTSTEFLKVFRLNSLDELPPLSAFQPAPETLSEAEQRLDLGDSVDVDDFIDDPEQARPDISAGLASTFDSDDLADKSTPIDVRAEDAEPDFSDQEVPGLQRSGAQWDAKGFDNDEPGNNTDSEMAVASGTSLAPRSGEDDERGSDLDQRQSSKGTRDEDLT